MVSVSEVHTYAISHIVRNFNHTSITNNEGSILLKSLLFTCTAKRAPFKILKQMTDFHKTLCEPSKLLFIYPYYLH